MASDNQKLGLIGGYDGARELGRDREYVLELERVVSSLRSQLRLQTEALNKIRETSVIYGALSTGRADMQSIHLWASAALAQSEGKQETASNEAAGINLLPEGSSYS